MGVCCTREENKNAIDVPPSVPLLLNPLSTDKNRIFSSEMDNSIIVTSNLANTDFTYNVKYKPRKANMKNKL
jgi:hypothetical protein